MSGFHVQKSRRSSTWIVPTLTSMDRWQFPKNHDVSSVAFLFGLFTASIWQVALDLASTCLNKSTSLHRLVIPRRRALPSRVSNTCLDLGILLVHLLPEHIRRRYRSLCLRYEAEPATTAFNDTQSINSLHQSTVGNDRTVSSPWILWISTARR